jgi:RNA-binding protein
MSLTNKQIKYLRSRAHTLKPVVIIGNAGLSDAVLNEIESSIEHHELIKVKINAATREDRQTIIDRICGSIHAEMVNNIGHIATFYRAAATPSIKLP